MVIRSATPELSSKKDFSLMSLKNSLQKFFISRRPILMMAALVLSERSGKGEW